MNTHTTTKSSGEHIRFVFFGSSRFSVIVLDELATAGFLPTLVVSTPDSPRGRGLTLTPSPVKVWAESRAIPVLTPAKLRGTDETSVELCKTLHNTAADVFITASYGKIIPASMIDMPRRGMLNVHPSMLPLLRGPAPIEHAILSLEKTGVSIMLVDEEVDHGAVVAQREISVADWPPYAEELETTLAHAGGQLLAAVLPQWVAGEIEAQEQDHAAATYTKKITSNDALVNLADDARTNLRKIRAFHAAPGAYFFAKKEDGSPLRVRITRAKIESGGAGNAEKLVLERVVPEGKKEMPYDDFIRGFRGTIS